MRRPKTPIAFNVAIALTLLLFGAAAAQMQPVRSSQPTASPSKEHLTDDAKSLTEVNKALSNPISSIWSLTFQQNTYWTNMPTGHDDRNLVNLQFQPVLPVALTDDWNLINRPALQLLNSTPLSILRIPFESELVRPIELPSNLRASASWAGIKMVGP